MTVYIPQVMDYNVRSAEKFGELKIMLPDRKQMIFASSPLVFELKKELKDFSDKDYLLLIGDPAIIGVCCAIAAEVNNRKFKVLKWDKRKYRYYDIEIDLNPRTEPTIEVRSSDRVDEKGRKVLHIEEINFLKEK